MRATRIAEPQSQARNAEIHFLPAPVPVGSLPAGGGAGRKESYKSQMFSRLILVNLNDLLSFRNWAGLIILRTFLSVSENKFQCFCDPGVLNAASEVFLL